jgi:hypothetical protein
MRALLPVQRDLVPVAIVLSREDLTAPQCAGERLARLGLVCPHVHLTRVWARQDARTGRVQARVLAAPRRFTARGVCWWGCRGGWCGCG